MEECWDNENMEIMKDEDDYLKLLRILFVDIHVNKYTTLCTCIILLFHVPLWAAQFYYYFQSFDLYFFMQYAPASLVFLYGFASMAIPAFYRNAIIKCKEALYRLRWPLKHASFKLQEDILQKATLFRNVAIINTILGLLTYITVLLRATKGKSWEILFQITFIKQQFPEHATLLIIIFYVTLIYFIFPMLTMAYMFSYFIWQLYFQALIATERITNITRNFPNDVELISDDTYQSQIFKRLRFCIIRWIEMKKFSLDYIAMVPVIVVLYALMSVLVIICYIGAWYFDPDKYYPLFTLITITSAYTGLVVAETGQIVEDEYTHLKHIGCGTLSSLFYIYKEPRMALLILFLVIISIVCSAKVEQPKDSLQMYTALMFLPWYTFNKKNMKMYLMSMSYATNPIIVSPLETLPINRRIIVQIYKVFSSVSALLANSKEKLKWG